MPRRVTGRCRCRAGADGRAEEVRGAGLDVGQKSELVGVSCRAACSLFYAVMIRCMVEGGGAG